MSPDERAERLLIDVGLPLIHDMRDNLAAAHRVVQYLDRCDLEALACVLAALVPLDLPVSQLAWWRPTQRPHAGKRQDHRRVA